MQEPKRKGKEYKGRVRGWWGGGREHQWEESLPIYRHIYLWEVCQQWLSDREHRCTKVPGRSSPPPLKKERERKKRNVSLTKHPHSCCNRRIQTPCNSLIRATLSRLCLFRRQISMQPERQTLAVNLNPNCSLEITRFDHDFLCLQPVLLNWCSIKIFPLHLY